MPLDEIKQEFVSFMEDARATEPYPRNFIGCLISLLIDPSPVSQERIMELTGYSQATVSMTLQRLKSLMPVRTIRTRGDRKHYYEYSGSSKNFIIDLWQKRLESQAISYHQIEKVLEKVKDKSSCEEFLGRFTDYLEYFLLILRLVAEKRNSGVNEFENGSDSKSLDDLKEQGLAALNNEEHIDFLNKLRLISLESSKHYTDGYQESKLSLDLKREYFSSIKTEFNPLFSQEAANQMIVVHSVFLEGQTTQEELEEVTLLPRSTISEVLNQSIKIGIIRVTKKEGSRIKFYQPAISFTDIMLGSFAQVEMHISQVIPKLFEYTKRVKKIPNSLNNKKPFLNALESLQDAYAFTRDFSRIMKMRMVADLKEQIDSGHPFI